jgi:hypothetical protein
MLLMLNGCVVAVCFLLELMTSGFGSWRFGRVTKETFGIIVAAATFTCCLPV